MTAMIAMSGGVDSSVAAYLSLQDGLDCIGATAQMCGADVLGDAYSQQGILDAKAVATRLGMDFHILDATEAFRRDVVVDFIRCYEEGLTPNPCIQCNKHIKFSYLLDKALELGCDYIVTGHYAKIRKDANTGRYLLYKAADEGKDQSYFLACLNQHQLSHARFPLGEYTKAEIREIAERQGFLNAKKRDSQDICFIPDGDYARFLREYGGVKMTEGDFVDRDGRVLGRHKGLPCYTTGQRKGLGLALPAPLYVRRKCMESNTVLLTPEEELYTTRLVADGFNWVDGEAPSAPLRVMARTRYNAKEAPAIVTALPDGRAEVVFDTPQRAATTGQAVVLYDGDYVVGGGRICEV